MAIPNYQLIMKPLLEYLAKNPNEHRMQDILVVISDHFNLTEEEKNELLPSGQQTVIVNRLGWARTYLKKAGLLEDPKKGYVKINQKGLEVINNKPKEVNNKFLKQFDSFKDFKKRRSKQLVTNSDDENQETESLSPKEMIEKGIDLLNADLAEELLKKIYRNTPEFFE
ncbi:MAG: restriction endonuclease, partial [Spirochaetes bacterium]|nr:restriction endonuclease [Spirochaetota bacterium]